MQPLPVTTRIALNNILLTTDFSEASKSALPSAIAIARLYGAKLFVAHVVPPEPYLAVPMEPIPLQADPGWNVAHDELESFLPESVRGIAHEEILQRGEMWSAISAIIRKHRIDLVVLGTHGRQGFRKIVMGSVAEKIYRQALCPVLTIGPGAGEQASTSWEPKRILFPTDFTDISLHALPYALSLAEENESTLTLLHMVPLIPWQYKEALEESFRKKLELLVQNEQWCKFEFEVGFDFPADAILNAASSGQSDLIVMGVNKPAVPGLASHSPWSIASHIVSAAPCPVLTVRG